MVQSIQAVGPRSHPVHCQSNDRSVISQQITLKCLTYTNIQTDILSKYLNFEFYVPVSHHVGLSKHIPKHTFGVH